MDVVTGPARAMNRAKIALQIVGIVKRSAKTVFVPSERTVSIARPTAADVMTPVVMVSAE